MVAMWWRLMLLAVTMVGCAPKGAPGMAPMARAPHAADSSFDELARVAPADGMRSLLVVHPRDACSASAATILLDHQGRFYGALAPGQAALLAVPTDVTRLEVLSSVDLAAPLHTWYVRGHVAVPPSPAGILLTARRVSARHCSGTGQHVDAAVAERQELESVLGDSTIEWLEPRVADGQQWLDHYRSRLDEIFGVRASPRPRSEAE